MLKEILKRLGIYRVAHNYVEMPSTKFHGFYLPNYVCSRCGKHISLEPWQMRQLPPEMKYGCTDD